MIKTKKTYKAYTAKVSLFLLLLITGCSSINENNYRVVEKGSFVVDFPADASLPKNQILSFSKFYSFGDELCVYFYDWMGGKLHLINIENQELNKTIVLTDIDSLLSNQKRADIKFINDTTLALFSYVEQKLILLNLRGEVIENYSTKPAEEPSVEALSYWDRQFDYYQERFHFIKVYNDIILNTKENMGKYFKRKGDFILDVSTDSTLFSATLNFPANLQIGKYYGDTDFYRCINNKGEQIYSFTSNDSLFVYNKDKFIKRVYAGSNSKPIFKEFDLTKTLDLNYSSKYITQEPRYQRIIFDEYNDLYYRAFKERSEYINKDNKKKRGSEIPWSLIILDSSLDIEGEVKINPSSYSMSAIHPTKKGILIYSDIEKSIKDEKYYISLVEIKKNNE